MNMTYHGHKGVHLIRTERGNKLYHFRLANWFVRLGCLSPSTRVSLFSAMSLELVRLYGENEGRRLMNESNT